MAEAQMKWVRISGNRRLVGYKVAMEWGRLLRNRTKYWNYRRAEINKEIGCAWRDDMLPLLQCAVIHFPEVIEEVAGMTQGAIEAGFDTSFPNVFAYALGETADLAERPHCSSMVVRTPDGMVLGHNEEWYEKRVKGVDWSLQLVPLLFSDVRLRQKSGHTFRFASVSYPFQLLGSAAGMNSALAFQGNSIGFAAHAQDLMATWNKRVPKTFFTRLMLEMKSIGEVESLYRRFHSTLPNHHYVCDARQAYSLDIKPVTQSPLPNKAPLRVKLIHTVDVHANDFLSKDRPFWRWETKEGRDDSSERYQELNELVRSNALKDERSVFLALEKLAQGHPEQTLATIVISARRGNFSCRAKPYFDSRLQGPLKRLSIE